MLRTIHLTGYLGEKYGNEFKLSVNSVSEAIHLLNANFEGFLRDIKSDGHYNVAVGDVVNEKTCITEEMVNMNFKKGDIWICPVIEGAGGNGVLPTVIGAVLIVGGAVASAYGFGGIGVPMMKIGAGVLIGGVCQMLTPLPSMDVSERESAENRPSFFFNGAINPVEQGNCIPVYYGRLRVGIINISASIDVEDVI